MKKLYLSLFLLLFLATAAFAKVNINTADVTELQTINGIGQTKAEAIVKYRQEHGQFETTDDLTEVKGIGDKTVNKIKEEVTTGK
ncbi:MAG: competence protein ComE [Desulfobulbaceae bacterium]|nr:competence protein ComE [Desulfobulbaceae bacterium]